MTILPPLADRTLWRVLKDNAERRPDRPAIVSDAATLTHTELWDETRRCAGGLRDAGVTEGDVVALMLDNSVDYFVVFAAVSFLGGVSVLTNTAYKGTILTHVLANSGAVHAVVEEHYADLLADAHPGTLRTLVVRGASSDDAEGNRYPLHRVRSGPMVEPLAVGGWQLLTVMYTSGTTGPSKGALTSHAAGYSVSYAPEIQGPHDESDVFLVVCPMFHTTGMLGGVYAALIVGASAHVKPLFSASRYWDDVRAAGATSGLLVGAMCDFLMHQPERADDRDHTLRTLFTVPRPASMTALMERFGIATTTAYGATEFGSVITNLSDDLAHRGSLGQMRAGMQVRLVDEHDIEVAEGSPGQAVIRPDEPWVLATGYLNNPEDSAALWRNGWLHTGDLLRRDPDGWFYFVDRVKDSMRRRGENISSVEVEQEVVAHPDVLECAALGVGDDVTNQEVLVVVRRAERASVTEEQLVRFLIDRMPYYAVPRFVRFVDDFPRTPTGKIRKADLRQLSIQPWDRETAGIVVRRPGSQRARYETAGGSV